jgi:hypothetical protein
MLDEAINVWRLGRRHRRLGNQSGNIANDRGRRMALDPGAEVRGGMLVTILVGLAERMVQLERRRQRGKGQKADAQQRKQQIASAILRQGFHQAGDNTNPLCYSQIPC